MSHQRGQIAVPPHQTGPLWHPSGSCHNASSPSPCRPFGHAGSFSGRGAHQTGIAEYTGRLDPPSGALAETPETVTSLLEAGEQCWTVGDGPNLFGCLLARVEGATVYLHRLAVHPSMRGMGLASEMLERAEHRARQGGLSQATLDVRCALTGNQRFFSGRGYEILDARCHPGYGSPTFYRMVKPLQG
jgi:ribosomal protein S18 acetylase RimI-like enzyme